MTQPDLLQQLNDLVDAARQAFAGASDAAQLEAIRIEFLGAKNGRIKNLQKQLGTVDPAQRPAVGKRFNEVKDSIEQSFQEAIQRIGSPEKAGSKSGSIQFDLSLPGVMRRLGKLHPITQTIDELQDILGRLGFTVVDGPEIEDEWHNFDALNIPPEHPARDPLDNFYLATGQLATGQLGSGQLGSGQLGSGQLGSGQLGSGQLGSGQLGSGQLGSGQLATGQLGSGQKGSGQKGSGALLLRSQTSTVQIRVMENRPPPIRVIALGRVYRPDEADPTHYPMFHQMEGLLVDQHVTMADLKSVLRLFAASYLGHDVHIRFRPSFFPFTEPSVEVDMSWNDGWIEIGGAGMVDPNVLRVVGYDPEVVTGFAFGFGVERLCMRRHEIKDIREFYRNDVRFLRQF